MSEESTVESVSIDALAELHVLVDTLESLDLIDGELFGSRVPEDAESPQHLLAECLRVINEHMASAGHADPEQQDVARNRFIHEYDQNLAEEPE